MHVVWCVCVYPVSVYVCVCVCVTVCLCVCVCQQPEHSDSFTALQSIYNRQPFQSLRATGPWAQLAHLPGLEAPTPCGPYTMGPLHYGAPTL